jgi:hypothetical protein
MLIGISNFFGMAALYIPFFYLVEAAEQSVSQKCLELREHSTQYLFRFTGN